MRVLLAKSILLSFLPPSLNNNQRYCIPPSFHPSCQQEKESFFSLWIGSWYILLFLPFHQTELRCLNKSKGSLLKVFFFSFVCVNFIHLISIESPKLCTRSLYWLRIRKYVLWPFLVMASSIIFCSWHRRFSFASISYNIFNVVRNELYQVLWDEKLERHTTFW